MPEPTIEELTNLLYAANPPLPGTDEVAHAYELLSDAEQAMPVVAVVWPLAVAEGRRQAAEAIRAQVVAGAVPSVALRSGAVLRANSVADWAARIAEGTADA